MGNWVNVSYALSGDKAELQDFENKLRIVEAYPRSAESYPQEILEESANELASILGGNPEDDFGGFWKIKHDRYDSLQWEIDANGREFLMWELVFKWGENPKLRKMIEDAYRTIKIYYIVFCEWGFLNSNDEDRIYFDRLLPHLPELHLVDGLHYVLNEGSASLHIDDCIKGPILNIPDQISVDGNLFPVISIIDAFMEDEYSISPAKKPENLQEVFCPQSVKIIGIEAFNGVGSLKSIHFSGDVAEIGPGAFCDCNELEKVTFGGKLDILFDGAFDRTPLEHFFSDLNYIFEGSPDEGLLDSAFSWKEVNYACKAMDSPCIRSPFGDRTGVIISTNN